MKTRTIREISDDIRTISSSNKAFRAENGFDGWSEKNFGEFLLGKFEADPHQEQILRDKGMTLTNNGWWDLIGATRTFARELGINELVENCDKIYALYAEQSDLRRDPR